MNDSPFHTLTILYGTALRGGTICLLLLIAIGLTGCTSLFHPVSGVPAHRLPVDFRSERKDELVPVDISRLRQPPPKEYVVHADDILGIYIEGVLGQADTPPPVYFPTGENADLPPAIGFPIPIRDNGTIALPLIEPIHVAGMKVDEVEAAIRKAYTVDRQILQPSKDRTIVTLMRPRQYQVIVMRQDGAAGGGGGAAGGGAGRGASQASFSTRGQLISLPAYKNDVLHALAQTGGLPGLEAKNEVQILKSSRIDPARRDEYVRAFYNTPTPDPCVCRPPIPGDPAIITIPLRLPPGQVPQFRPEDIVLEEGDIVFIQSRETEFFYTGGLLGGAQIELPRDYDLDILGALALAGQGVTSPVGGGGGGGGMGMGMGGGQVVPPGQVFILRKTPCNEQITISVDLNRAINDPRARPLIQAGDIVILQYKPQEEAMNFGISTFFTFGIRELFSND